MAENSKNSTNHEVKNTKRSGRSCGFVLGALATIATGVVIKETCNKNIIDGADKAYKAGKAKAKDFIEKKKKARQAKKESEE